MSFAEGAGVGDLPGEAPAPAPGRPSGFGPQPVSAAAVAPIAAPNSALLLIAIAATHAIAVADWMPVKVRMRDRGRITVSCHRERCAEPDQYRVDLTSRLEGFRRTPRSRPFCRAPLRKAFDR